MQLLHLAYWGNAGNGAPTAAQKFECPWGIPHKPKETPWQGEFLKNIFNPTNGKSRFSGYRIPGINQPAAACFAASTASLSSSAASEAAITPVLGLPVAAGVTAWVSVFGTTSCS